jgi:hypothetical protein
MHACSRHQPSEFGKNLIEVLGGAQQTRRALAVAIGAERAVQLLYFFFTVNNESRNFIPGFMIQRTKSVA